MDLGLKGRVALVTGSYRGTGAGIARRLAEEGAEVVVHGFTKGQTDELVNELKDSGKEASGLELDPRGLSKNEFLRGIPEIDILINNYGTPAGSDWKSTESWDSEWEENVMIAVSFTQAVIGGMKLREWGRILFIGTVGIDQPSSHSPGYYGSKASLEPIMRSLAIELRLSGITVNMLNPGLIATSEVKEMIEKRAAKEGIEGDWEELVEWATTKFMPNLTGGISSPESIGDVVAFLVSERTSQINGAVIPVDGGWLYA